MSLFVIIIDWCNCYGMIFVSLLIVDEVSFLRGWLDGLLLLS